MHSVQVPIGHITSDMQYGQQNYSYQIEVENLEREDC
jgi:hypothetical protein